ncbi:MAG: M15 family metallopeptidase [Idiomarina sp.]|nr:M15 family metallopeptidase [Idiomarina sp.]
MMQIDAATVTGLNDTEASELVNIPEGLRLHAEAAQAIQLMKDVAATQGVTINVASGFRSYAHQVRIWERKFHSEALADLAEAERIAAIMRWSAVPGTSRHHWGTDMDLYDGSQLERDALRLEPWEYAENGPCHTMTQWLMVHAETFGFYRPYDIDRGGVAPEPWHWSYVPVAKEYARAASVEQIARILTEHPFTGSQRVIAELDEYVARYVTNVAPYPDHL